MADDLISKKELLEQYHISYGALYRWKRKGLIPDEWFIRRATVNGQETYFDRAAICERIDFILSQKDSCSLDDMVHALYPGQHAKRLVIAGKYGTRSFDLAELDSVRLEGSNGETKELLQQLQEVFP